MINIREKQNCCGCHACASICPKQCISMEEDNEGFLYPEVDKSICIDCALCDKVCPIINQSEPSKPIKVYAAKNINEEIRFQSSSGGIFTPLAESIIDDGGVVFGARFDENWNVVHSWADTKEGIAAFRGSKYVQSTIGNTYNEAREFLKQGRKVLFSGTPCQIAGLKKFLRKEYDNLLTMDIICHGVPSPLVWKKYLCEYSQGIVNDTNENKIITNISFRDKSNGWKKYLFKLNYTFENKADNVKSHINTKTLLQPIFENSYLKSYLTRLNLRQSCCHCPSKEGKSNSDITIGDFWGISKYSNIDDDKGCSVVIINTTKGREVFEHIKVNIKTSEQTLEQIKTEVTTYHCSVPENNNRFDFFINIHSISLKNLVNKYSPMTLKEKVKNYFQKLLYLDSVIYDAPGQTCNRLWSYLDTVAWAITHDKKISILFWDDSIKYFDKLRENPHVNFSLYNKRLISLIGENRYKTIITKIFANRFTFSFYSFLHRKTDRFIVGWQKRAEHKYFPHIYPDIYETFSPNPEIVTEVRSFISKYRDDGFIIIGIHIRRGDYKDFMGGKYYFSHEEYAIQMSYIQSLFQNRRVCFLISTNENYEKQIFNSLTLCDWKGKTAIHDLYALSLCDYIAGPLSTFSRWASYYGQVPLYFIEKNTKIESLKNFSIIKDFYTFENGERIINLSDQK